MHKCKTLNYIEHFFILASAVSEYISIPSFVSLFIILKDIISYAIGLKICAVTARINNISQ